nr:hypothetical protein [Gammaproteobacteria bacterium]
MKTRPRDDETEMLARTVYGVDWSGATDAGKHVWIAQAALRGGQLCLDELIRGDKLANSGVARDRCMDAMVAWIQALRGAVIGFDFPFSMPMAHLVAATSPNDTQWAGFMDFFERSFTSPDAFRDWCLEVGGGRELKRRTDRLTKTPFSAYNLRMYRQTYWGLRLLVRLRGSGNVRALPVQRAAPTKTWLLETCPAS